jgi:hypothetical protein
MQGSFPIPQPIEQCRFSGGGGAGVGLITSLSKKGAVMRLVISLYVILVAYRSLIPRILDSNGRLSNQN